MLSWAKPKFEENFVPSSVNIAVYSTDKRQHSTSILGCVPGQFEFSVDRRCTAFRLMILLTIS